MQETNRMCDQLINEFTENYMEKLFYFCLKKTGNNVEAEDLTQDIALQIITALNRGAIPTSFSRWVWQIAQNRYSVWATVKHNRNESVTGSDIGDYEIEDESKNILDEIIHTEQMASASARVGVHQKAIIAISSLPIIQKAKAFVILHLLSLFRRTVQQRLHRARNYIERRYGYGKRIWKTRYSPENIAFVMNGMYGKNGEPWNYISAFALQKHSACGL